MRDLAVELSANSNPIVIFIPTLDGGGAERVMVTLANAIATRGFAVDLLLVNATGPLIRHVSPAVRIVDLQATRVITSLIPLMGYLRRRRPAALLVAITHTSIIALLARALTRVPVKLVVSERSTISKDFQNAHGLLARLIYRLVPRLYSLADGICTVSQAASADLTRFTGLPEDRVQTIYNPFDLSRIEMLAKEGVPHPWFGVDQPPVILAMGRLTKQKDFATLLRAFVQMRKTHYARLLILGEGELRQPLLLMLREYELTMDDVQLPGFVENPFAWLAHCSLFVLSSLWEGLPGALIEALACGVPVVSTDCPSGPNEILQNGRWGLLVPVADAAALAHAMVETLDTPRALLPDGRLRAADFELDRAVDAYLKILDMPPHPKAPNADSVEKQCSP